MVSADATRIATTATQPPETSTSTQPRETSPLEPLVRDLVAWVAAEPRAYADVIDAWRTSCPRLMVWEEACDRGLVARRFVKGEGATVHVTDAGRTMLASSPRKGRDPTG